MVGFGDIEMMIIIGMMILRRKLNRKIAEERAKERRKRGRCAVSRLLCKSIRCFVLRAYRQNIEYFVACAPSSLTFSMSHSQRPKAHRREYEFSGGAQNLRTLLRRSDGRASVANWGGRQGELAVKETDRAKSLTTFSVLYSFAGKIRNRTRTHTNSEAVSSQNVKVAQFPAWMRMEGQRAR